MELDSSARQELTDAIENISELGVTNFKVECQVAECLGENGMVTIGVRRLVDGLLHLADGFVERLVKLGSDRIAVFDVLVEFAELLCNSFASFCQPCPLSLAFAMAQRVELLLLFFSCFDLRFDSGKLLGHGVAFRIRFD
jgi:hypothetical protein